MKIKYSFQTTAPPAYVVNSSWVSELKGAKEPWFKFYVTQENQLFPILGNICMQCKVVLKGLLECKIVIVVTRIIIDSILYLSSPSLVKWILSIAVILFLQTFKFIGFGSFLDQEMASLIHVNKLLIFQMKKFKSQRDYELPNIIELVTNRTNTRNVTS